MTYRIKQMFYLLKPTQLLGYFISLFFGLVINAHSQEIEYAEQNLNSQYKTVIQGEIIGKEVDSLYLYKDTSDPRGKRFIIPVKDGKFEYTLETEALENYKLIYPYQFRKASWHNIRFFSDPDTLNLELYPGQADKNQIKGGDLTNEYHRFQEQLISATQPQIDSLYQEINLLKSKGEFYNDSAKVILRKIDKSQNREERRVLYQQLKGMRDNFNEATPAGETLTLKIDSLIQIFYNRKLDYIKNNTSPVSYYEFYNYLITENQHPTNLDTLKHYYQRYAKKFPDHPYTYLIRQSLQANETITEGNNFVNFRAPDINGNSYTLGHLIEDKIAILNLWASWCGPCIRKSRKIVPLYHKYKDRGFTVVGVAREFEDTNRLKKSLKREQFPWLNLVDLDDQHEIWRKYGIPYSGGGIFVIDKEGEILSIDPTAKEIASILEKRL